MDRLGIRKLLFAAILGACILSTLRIIMMDVYVEM